jgi:hypothetical protein
MAVSALVAAGSGAAVRTTSDSPTQVPPNYNTPYNDGLGVTSGSIKHVWVIIMENKSYDATFTGLNGNSYLWQTLPEQGALLTNYYGTGHSSEDNYLSLVSGQAPISDDENDCPNYTSMAGSIDTTGSLKTNGNFGQFESAAGPNAPIGDNGCVYPDANPTDQSQDNPSNTVETLFNQMDAAGKSWKVYAQDLDGDANSAGDTTSSTTHSAGAQYCGAPYSAPGPVPSSTQATNPNVNYANPGSAVANDQYVPKHNPAPWFASVLDSGECSTHVAPVLGTNDQFDTDLQTKSTTPDLSVIVPNNCSDAHDAVCAGNNLSGGFGTGSNSQIANAPENQTGGLYAGDLFLQKVIPEIESSPAFSDGGLIDVTFDEAFPPFTWQNSFVNSSLLPSTAFGSVTTDEAGETLYGRSVNWEPTGPNVPITISATGQVLTPGPGFGSSLDRPNATTAVPGATVACSNGTSGSNGWVTTPSDGCLLMGASTTAGTSGDITGTFTADSAAVTIPDTSTSYPLSIKDEGREVNIESTANGGDTGDETQESADGGYYLGQVTNTYDPDAAKTTGSSSPDTFSFQLLDSQGKAVTDLPDGGNFKFTLGAQSAGSDPLFDAYDYTTGGGDTGSVLISPYIKPGTVSNTYYNHYSLLRTLEDIFQVDKTGDGTAAAMTTQGGLDGEGHLGYAAQPGLAPFGTDVFTNSSLDDSATTVTQTTTTPGKTVTTPGKTVTTPGQTVTTPGQNVTTPGQNVTTPGKTVTRKVPVCVVPNVKGYALPEATAIIKAAQCKVGKISGNTHGVVTKQSVAAGKHESSGTRLGLTFTAKKR